MKIYNTLTRKKETFKPVKKGQVKIYVCGPTVYGLMHIGNARTFMTFDVLRRYLEYKGHKVIVIQNITDVGHLTDVGEDKIMKGAAKKKMSAKAFAEYNIKEYFKDLALLDIKKPDKSPKASEHIKDMIDIVKKLIKKGYAYQADDYVYFDISKFKNYGKLSRQSLKDLEKRKTEPHPKKRNQGDFSLWIGAPKDYPMKWKSPWGEGFPGWHIECSTMGSKYLSLPFDIHGGGKDLIFPHHENEIAQAEAATGKKFVNYWMHGEFILINGKKMSKSLGNIISARDAAKKYGARAIRYFLIASHYKTEINLTEDSMKSAKRVIARLDEFMNNLQNSNGKEKASALIKKAKKGFEKALDDNLNTPKAVAALFEFIKEVNKLNLAKKDAQEVRKVMLDFDKVLGLNLDKIKPEKIPKEVQALVDKREKARKDKKWSESDKIREEIRKKGWDLQDTSEGPKVRKK